MDYDVKIIIINNCANINNVFTTINIYFITN